MSADKNLSVDQILSSHCVSSFFKMASRFFNCKNSPDDFCYICGEYLLSGMHRPITEEVCKLYFEYFGFQLSDNNQPWAPNTVCFNCIRGLKTWKNGHKKQMAFGIPMIWSIPRTHHDDCYFCGIKTFGFNKSNRKILSTKATDLLSPHSLIVSKLKCPIHQDLKRGRWNLFQVLKKTKLIFNLLLLKIFKVPLSSLKTF